MSAVVFIAGSPSEASRSSRVARAVAEQLEKVGVGSRSFSLGDFDAGDVLHARTSTPSVAAFIEATAAAPAIVLSSPVYKGIYTGALKAIVDLIGYDALVDKPALGIATARLPPHGETVAAAYRQLFDFFRARALDPLFFTDEELAVVEGQPAFREGVARRIAEASRKLATALRAPSNHVGSTPGH
jgi:FMN reductase